MNIHEMETSVKQQISKQLTTQKWTPGILSQAESDAKLGSKNENSTYHYLKNKHILKLTEGVAE